MLKMLAQLVGLAVIVILLIYIFQDKMLFYPQRILPEQAMRMNRIDNIEKLEFQMTDGTMTRGWIVHGKGRSAGLLFYYGGNAEELSTFAENAEPFNGWSLVLVNYRGYGESEGKPGEKNLLGDSLEIFDAIVGRADLNQRRVVLMGRSLGTGVAVHLASKRPHNGVILVSPYDSMLNLAKRHYPFLPVEWLLRHRFDSEKLAGSIHTPALFIVASDDSIVPKSHSLSLARVWGGKVQVNEVANTDHNNIGLRPEYGASIQKYLKDIQ